MNVCKSSGASGKDAASFQVFSDCRERFLLRRLPAIVVEPTDGGDVESGELRWPPDEAVHHVTEGQAQGTGAPVEKVESQTQGGV